MGTSTRRRTFIGVILLFIYVSIFYILHNSMILSKESDDTWSLFDGYNNHNSQQQRPFVDIPAPSPSPSSSSSQQQQQQQQPQEVCQSNPQAVNRNADPNHTQAHIDFWRRLDNETISDYRESWKSFMAGDGGFLPDQPEYEYRKGVVMVAGNRDTFERALTAVKMLRRHKCYLPVEVWHLSDESPSNTTTQSLNELGAVSRDLSEPTLPRPMNYRLDAENSEFQIKAAAIINSNFEQVLYLDSDNTPTRDPSFLFETSAFKATGAMFWPDFWKTHTENKIFEILDIPCKDEWEQESGQMVIDKTKSWLPLQLTWYMQEHSDLYFQFLNGDKDTFKYAWKALGTPYYMTETFLGMGGLEVETFCGHTMLQYSDDDSLHPLFVHANLMKITDKNGFMVLRRVKNEEGEAKEEYYEQPWQQIKRYVDNRGITNLSPSFRIAPGGKACMNFVNSLYGEPETVIEDFDQILPDFRNAYFELGGIGGETRG